MRNILFFIIFFSSLSGQVVSANECAPCASKAFGTEEELEAVAACIDFETFGSGLTKDQILEERLRLLGINWDDAKTAIENDVYPEDKIQGFLQAYFGNSGIAASDQSPSWKAEQLCKVLYEDADAAKAEVEDKAKL